jgi:hypothetical protein
MDVETLAQETTEPSTANSVEENINKDFGSGNLSQSDVANSLLQRMTGEQSEDDKVPQDEAEPLANSGDSDDPDGLPANSGESEETEDNEVSAETADEVEETETVSAKDEYSQEQIDVLSQLGVDIDSLDSIQLDKVKSAFGVQAINRFKKLTDQKQELNDKIDSLKQNLDELENQPKQNNVTVNADIPYGEISSLDAFEEEVEKVETMADWADEQLENDPLYDDDGNEYLVEHEGVKYDKNQLRNIKTNSKNLLKKNSPLSQRKNFIHQQIQSDTQAMQDFTFLSDNNSDEFQTFSQLVNDPYYSKMTQMYPNGNYMLALMVAGNSVVKNGSKPIAKKVISKKIPSATTSSVASGSQTRSPNSDLKKQYQQAQSQFEKSGNQADLVKANLLKRQLAQLQ